MFKAECPISGRPGFFGSMRINTPEEERQSLLDAWSTPEQQIFNLMHTQCDACRGRGYKVYRSRGQLVRERAGCDKCLGIGVVPRKASTSTDTKPSHESA